jgi:hypothetical protein
MCFSATGSFGVGAVIAAVGVVAVARDKPRTHRLVAAVPLLFAAQQAAEGTVWLTMGEPASVVHRVAVVAFLAVAVVIWPIWMPLALLSAESQPGRRRGLRALTALGVGVAIYAAIVLGMRMPTARIHGHSLAYSYAEPKNPIVLALHVPLYVLATVVPFFVSSLHKAKWMGALLAVGLVVTYVLEHDAMTSTWCFFAAILSGVVVMSLAAEQRLLTRAGSAC